MISFYCWHQFLFLVELPHSDSQHNLQGELLETQVFKRKVQARLFKIVKPVSFRLSGFCRRISMRMLEEDRRRSL